LDKDLKKLGGVERRFLSQRLAEREALLSLGDAKVGEALIEHIRDGIAWKSALKENDVDVSKIVYTAKPADYIFPWDEIYHIKGKSKIDNRKTQRKTALFHQYKMAENTAKNIE
jgi:hypothetical protein